MGRVLVFILIALMAVALVGCDEAERVLKDPRDGRVYKTTTIGAQTWMAENLNYEIADSYCYNNDTSNCKKYGHLYTMVDADNAPYFNYRGRGFGNSVRCVKD